MAAGAIHSATDGEIRVVPYGRAATSALAEAIVAGKGAAGDLLAPVTVIVPSNVAGLSARRLLGSGRIDGGGGLVNVAFVTPSELAATLAPAPPDRAPLTDAALVAAVRSQLAYEREGFFSPVAGHRATEEALCAVYDELSGAHHATIDALATSLSARTRAVVATARAVRARLTHTIDKRDVAKAATAHVRGGAPVARLGTVVLYLLTDVAPTLGDLLREIAARTPVTAIVGCTGEPAVDAMSLEAMVRLVPSARVDAAAAESIAITQVISAGDSDDEVRCVLRDVMALADAARRDWRDAGVGVSILCPGMVDTNLYNSRAHRQDDYGGASALPPEQFEKAKAFMAQGQDPGLTASLCLEGIERGEFLIIADPSIRRFAEVRAGEVAQALDIVDTRIAPA